MLPSLSARFSLGGLADRDELTLPALALLAGGAPRAGAPFPALVARDAWDPLPTKVSSDLLSNLYGFFLGTRLAVVAACFLRVSSLFLDCF